jgi:sugar (pentulose or hexulose) kinase
MAGIGAGVYRDLGEAAATVQIVRRHKPDFAAHQRYRALYELYRVIYQQLQDAWWLRHRVLQQIAEMP